MVFPIEFPSFVLRAFRFETNTLATLVQTSSFCSIQPIETTLGEREMFSSTGGTVND